MAWQWGLSPVDSVSTVAYSPWKDLVKNYRVHATHWLIHVQARRARHDAMLATLREHAPGERDPAVVAGLVAWASGAFAGADASALPRLCQHLAVTERAAGDLLWLQGDVADKYYVLHAGLIKLFRHSTPIMTRECRDLYGDRRAVLRRRPNELIRAARGAADKAPARDDEPALAPRPPAPTPAPTPAPAPASPHVAEAPAPASLHVVEAPAPAQGIADAPAPAAAAPAPAEARRPRPAAAPAEARRPRPEADPEWDTLGVATKDVLPGTGLGEGALLRSVGVTGASSSDAPYVDTAACIEPCVILEVRGDDYRAALGAEHLRRVEIMQTRKFFRDLGPFKHWRPESFMQLADKATRRHIPAHAVVARRGASCDTVAFVVQGELKLEGAVAVGDRRERVDLLRLGPGSMLGDVEIAEGLTHFLATATTTRRSMLLEVPRLFFEAMLELNDGAKQRENFERIVNARRDVQAKAALDALVRSGAAKKGGAAPPAHARICEDFEAALERRVANALEASWARSPPKAAAAVKDALARRPARRDSGASRVGVVKGLEHASRTSTEQGSEIDEGAYRDTLAVTMSALRTDSIRDARRTATLRRRVTAPTPADIIGKPSIVDTPDVHSAHRALTELSAITDRQRRALPSETLLRMTREILTPDMNALMKSKRRRRPGDFT